MKAKPKTESIEEFLARGGKITIVPPKVDSEKSDTVRKIQSGGPVTIMTLDEADLFYGEGKAKVKKQSKPQSTVDMSALPEALRKKFIAKLQDEVEDVEEF